MLEGSVAILPEAEVTSALDKPDEFANTAKYDDFFHRRKLGLGTNFHCLRRVVGWTR